MVGWWEGGMYLMQGLTNPSFSHFPGSPLRLPNGLELQYSLYILYIFLGKWDKKSLAQPKFGLALSNWAMDLSSPDLMSPGRPTDIGLQLGKACYPFSRYESRGGCFYYFFCFFTFIPVPLSSLTLSFISTISFLPFSRRRHKMTHKGWRVIKPQHNQSIRLSRHTADWSESMLVTRVVRMFSTWRDLYADSAHPEHLHSLVRNLAFYQCIL